MSVSAYVSLAGLTTHASYLYFLEQFVVVCLCKRLLPIDHGNFVNQVFNAAKSRLRGNSVQEHSHEDGGEQTSDKEASFIAELVSSYIDTYHLSPLEIAVLSPFRAQTANIKRHLKKSRALDRQTCQQIAVDTVDKMQGQEREVIIYSMTAGDPDYIADMAEFLFNPNKLNVAFSRAKFKLIIVGNMKRLEKADTADYPHIRRMMESKFVKYL